MPEPTIKSKTGSAPVIKNGHTESGQFGASTTAQPKGRGKARDLTVK